MGTFVVLSRCSSSLLLLLSLIVPTVSSKAMKGRLPAISLSLREHGHRVFVDEYGRERIFHGTNAIVKGPPWLPSRDKFDPNISLTAEDFQYMKSAGLNAIRLGVMWPGVEPVRGKYDLAYLKRVQELVKDAAAHGIYILADMHQDVLSERLCGEGIPLWASQPDESWFKFPEPLATHRYAKDPATGLPTRQACEQREWIEYHGSYAAASAFERLYTNHDNLTNSWGAFWQEVAKTFTGVSSIIGFEIINEPFVGNFFRDPLLLDPTYGDRWRLQPAYDVVASYIRKASPDRLIFFSGCTYDRTGRWVTKVLPRGFTHAPGGNDFANRSVSSFHFYIPPQQPNTAKAYFNERLHDAQRLGTGLYLTESCCHGFFDIAAPIADSMGISWMQWEWKPFCRESNETLASKSQYAEFGSCKTGFGGGPFGDSGEFSEDRLRDLARPFASAIAGNFSEASFNASSDIFTLRFTLNPSIRMPTEIVATKLRYPAGYDVVIEPLNVVILKRLDEGFELHARPNASFGQVIDVRVTPAASTPPPAAAAGPVVVV